MSLELVDLGFAAVAPKFGNGVRLIGGFVGGPVVPPLPEGWLDVRLVVALPAERIAGLRPWRDSITMVVETAGRRTMQVTARDVLTWGRMVLRGHGGTLATILNGHAVGDAGRLADLQSLAMRCINEDTASYFEALGQPTQSWHHWPQGTPDISYRIRTMEEGISECRPSGAEPR